MANDMRRLRLPGDGLRGRRDRQREVVVLDLLDQVTAEAQREG